MSLKRLASLAHTQGVGPWVSGSVWGHAIDIYTSVAAADTGDQPWDAELPAEALVEIKAAKGTVYEMGAKPWWCGPHGTAGICRVLSRAMSPYTRWAASPWLHLVNARVSSTVICLI